jgi:hypothetical protein
MSEEVKDPPPGWRVVEGSGGDVWTHRASMRSVSVDRKNGKVTTERDVWDGNRHVGFALVEDVYAYLYGEAHRVVRELEHNAKMTDATDETRLAAGWRQEVYRCDPAHYVNRIVWRDGGQFSGPARKNEEPRMCERAPLDLSGDGTPVPGPAGHWRLHASGVWVRWVCP